VFLKLADLQTRANRLPQVPAIRIQIQSRYSYPLASLTLLFLAFPFLATFQIQSYLRGLFFCLILVFAFYGLSFFLLDLGSRGAVSAMIGAWGPTVAFGFVGLGLFLRMKT